MDVNPNGEETDAMDPDWASNDDVNAKVMPLLSPKEQAVASLVCRQWNASCVASPFIHEGGFPLNLIHNVVVTATAWSPEGDQIAFGFNDGSVRMFQTNAVGGERREILMPDMPPKYHMLVRAIAFSGQDLLVGYVCDSQAVVRVRRRAPAAHLPAEEHALPRFPYFGVGDVLKSIVFAPKSTADAIHIAITYINYETGYVSVWVWAWINQWNHMTETPFRFRGVLLGDVVFSNKVNYFDVLKIAIVTVDDVDDDDGDDDPMHTLHVSYVTNVQAMQSKRMCAIHSVAWTPNNDSVAVVDKLRSLRVYRLGQGEVLHAGRALCVAAAPAVLFADGRVDVIGAAGAVVSSATFDPPDPSDIILRAQMSPNGRAVLLALRTGGVRIAALRRA